MPEASRSGKARGGAAVMLPVGGKRIFRKTEWRAPHMTSKFDAARKACALPLTSMIFPS
jgi:hypothetical protein